MYERILVPSDASPASVAAVLHAVALARVAGSELFLLQVIPPYQVPVYLEYAPMNLHSEEEYLRLCEQSANRHLAMLAAQAEDAGVKCQRKVVFHPGAAQAITDAASDLACQLIVMGSHGRSGLERLFLGSVTARVLPLSRVPVLVHRSTEAELATAEGLLGSGAAGSGAAPEA
jgi:nucleotide-binding universal stress UspA family protein